MGKTKHGRKILILLPIFVIIALWLVFSAPYLFKGLVPFPSKYLVTFFAPWNASYGMPVKNNAMPDVITQIYPWKQISIETWKQGQIPLWNPYAFGGTPHAGNYQSAVFSPVNILFMILPFIDAWSIMILLQPLLAGMGMYLFLRSLDRSKFAALMGAIGFMFCGFITTWMAYGTLGYAAGTLPWIFCSIAGNFKKSSFISRITLPLCIALSFLSGHFQISFYVCIASILFILFEGLQKRNYGEIGRSLLGIGVGIGLAAPQLLLTYRAYAASTRAESFLRSEVIPWQYIITLFSPDFYGNPVTRNDWFGHYAEWAGFIGVVPLLLAGFSLSQRIRGYKRFFGLLVLAVLLFAYRTPVSDSLFALKIPVLSTSAASRIIALCSFALAVLSAFGFDDVATYWKSKNRKPIMRFVLGALLCLGMIWVIIFLFKPFPIDKLIIAKRNLLLPSAIAVIALGCLLIGFWKKRLFRLLAIVCFVVLALFDSYRFASKWMPFEPREFMYPETKSIAYLQEHVGIERVFGNIGNEVAGIFSIPLIEGYDAMYQARFGEFVNASSNGIVVSAGRSVVQFDKSGRFKDETFQLLGVRYIYHRKSDGHNVWAFPVWQYPEGEMVKRFEDEHYEVYEYTSAFPRAFLASSYEVRRDPQEIIDTLFRNDFDRRNTLVLEKEPSIKSQPGEGAATIDLYTPNKVRIRTISAVPKLLFLSDVYDDGWEATIDGIKTEVYRADYDFRAIAVPAGIHTVEYRYHPKIFRL